MKKKNLAGSANSKYFALSGWYVLYHVTTKENDTISYTYNDKNLSTARAYVSLSAVKVN